MKRVGIICIISLVFISAFSQQVTEYVDLFICTSGDHGQLDPSATVPFGMVKLGPDTDPGNHSGYNYDATKIVGFSHNRIGGVGCSGTGGNLRILPGIGDINIKSTLFKKDSENASPGFYSVEFSNNIQIELTATNQTGIHRYIFPETDSAFIIVDVGSSFARLISASKKILNKHEFAATITAKTNCNDGTYNVHYHLWSNKELIFFREKDNKLFFKFKTKKKEEVLLYVTASTISPEYAKEEWEAGTKYLTFEQAKKQALEQWNELLSRIIVEGKEEYKTLFYTHLYHIFLNPVKTENHLKEFRGTDGQVHKSENYVHYDTWSMWDNFRNKFSLYPIIIPDISTDIANSLLDLYKYGKSDAAGDNEPAPTARTEHTVITLLDLYRRGITDFDISSHYNLLTEKINNIRRNSPDSKLEQSYDYWALAQFAKILNKEDDYQMYMNKALEYKKIWEQYFLLITDKSDIMHGDGLYEGTLWQYRWHVQFDLDGIINMIGSKEKFTEQLEYFFENNLYNHGNQPDIHVPFLFNYGTKPWLTQKWVNRILTKEMYQYYGTHNKWANPYVGRIYKAEPVGYIPEMDDDEGTMSGWYVLSSMGLYPVLVGKPEFQISSPVFDKILIKLNNGKTFEIISKNFTDNNFYIESATLNGKIFDQTFISNDDILKGGKLIFNLSDKPNKDWGR